MAENLRKRVSKWDVETNLDEDPSKITQGNLLSQKSDTSQTRQETNLEWNASKCGINKFLKHIDTEGDSTGKFIESSEVEQFTEYADDGSIRTFNDSSKISECNKLSDMEIDPEDDCKKSCEELTSESQTKAKGGGDKETEGRGTASERTHRRNMSPGVHTQRRRSRSYSPRNGRNRSHRSRSNSRGRSKSRSWSQSRSRSRSWSRSPSYRSKRGAEKRVGRERMVSRGEEPCRDFTSGRCRRGNQCRFLHDDAHRHYEKHSSRVTLEKGDSNRRDDACRQYEKHSFRGILEKGDSHDDTRKLYNKQSSRSTLEKGDSKTGRGRSSGYDNKDNLTSLQAERDNSHHNQSNRHGNQYDDDKKKSELHRNNRSSEHCYDFTKGRCQIGSVSSRFVHHDSASQGGLNADDEVKEKAHGRRDADASFQLRIEPHKADDDTPRQFFAVGHSHRGDGGKFSHQDMTLVGSKERLRGGNRLGEDVIVLSVPNSGDRPAGTYLTNSSQQMTNVASATKGASVEFAGREVLREDPLLPKYANRVEGKYGIIPQEAPQRSLPSQIHNGTPLTSEQHQQVASVTMKSMPDSTSFQQSSGMKGGGSGGTTSLGDTLGQNGNHHAVVHPLHGQNYAPNVKSQQVVPSFASGGQTQQQASFPLPLNQFVGLQVPSTLQNFNIGLQSQVALPSPLIGQRFQSPLLGVQGQQNLQVLHNGQIQQNFNLIGQNQQRFPTPYAGNNQLNVNLNGQPQQNISLPSHIPHGQIPVNQIVPSQTSMAPIQSGQSQQQHHDFNSQSQQTLPPPQNLQMLQALASLVGSNSQNHHAALQPAPDTRSLKPNEQNHQINLQQSSNSHQPTETCGDGLSQKIDTPTKPSEVISDTSTSKVVTSEQAVQISNLSASLAQFFGSAQNLPQLYATLNPLSVVGSASSHPFLHPGSAQPVVPAAIPTIPVQPGQVSLEQQHQDPAADNVEPTIPDTSEFPPGFSANAVEQKDPKLENSQAAGMTTLAFAGEEEQAEVIADNELKEVNEAETDRSKKEQATRSEDADTEIKTDGESKRGKDTKGFRLFKCALVEFVKDILKPHWKEGLLSKEVHKTIVKKVVDKVTVVMQNGTVPQTPEKIEHYLSHSKAKLNKLVQAYMEKYA